MDGITLTANIDKLRFHADRAERAQMQIEAMERLAVQAAASKQHGRMQRSDKTVLSDGYMADVELRDKHEYRALIGTRNAHQAQVALYSALILAGVQTTGYVRNSIDGGQRYELMERP